MRQRPPPRRFVTPSAVLLGLLCASAATAADGAPALPASGREAIEAMRAAYAGRWYTTLTFVQKTRKPAPAGKETVETWFESLRHTDAQGTQLRIDVAPLADGNGVLYTASQTRRFKAGKQVALKEGGNALLPLIEGVYVQPLERTVAELRRTAVDLSRPVVAGTWEKRPVWILGATSGTDLRSPQIWVDVERKVVVRALLAPVPGAPLMDIRIGRFVPLAGGWLGTLCEFLVDGKLEQAEEYEDWKAGMKLPEALFDPASFASAPHWAAALSKR
ncbi:MAG TPA: hypothetical protein VGG91_02985 [Myxococcaceae bacterium]